MTGTYDPVVVALSVLIAIVAAYTALDMATRVLAERGRRRRSWLLGGSFAMGIGIWSMHFVGMLAFRLPVAAAYDVPLTAVSAAIAIVGSALALLVVSRERRAWTLVAGGVLFGLAISGMHYTGMAAMRMPARISYDPLLVALSIAIAIGAACGALWIMFRLGADETVGVQPLKMAGGVVLGFAIVGMHYTAMAAAEFVPITAALPGPGAGVLGTTGLTALVVMATLTILSLALVAASADRKRLVLLVEQARRREAESARERVTSILESIADHFFALDRSWRFTYVNRRAEQFFGRSREELLGQRIWDLFPEAEGGKLHEEYRRAIAEGVPVSVEEESAIAPGQWIEVRAYPSEDGLSIYFRDVTEEREAERALRASEERYRQLFERSPIGIYRSSPEGEILATNPAMTRMLGYSSPEELAGRPVAEYGYASAEDRRRFLAAMERDGEVRGLETVWLRRDGTSIHIRESARAVRAKDGRILYYEGNIEDVTDRKEAEEALRREKEFSDSIISSSNDGILVFDREFRYTVWNPSMERMSGMSAEEVLGRVAFDVFPFLKETGEDEYFRAALEGQSAESEDRLYVVPSTGRQGYFRGHYSALRDSAGEVVGGLAIIRDVTQQRELEGELVQSQKMDAVGQLAGGIAHDFNNLLTSIQGNALLLLEELKEDAAPGEAAREIASAAERAAVLTRQLLTFSRREVVQPRRLDLNSVVLEMEGMLRRLIGSDADLAVEPTAEEAGITADLSHVRQVILNLALNARDAVDEGGRIRIATQRVEIGEDRAAASVDAVRVGNLAPGCYTALVVEDTGRGMDPDTLERVFEPFFTTKGAGKGLGLSTVHGIVNQNGGAIEVESTPAAGTTFTVYLPSAKGLAEPVRPGGADQYRAAPSHEGSAATVLIVEDEPAVRSLARKVLRRQGYRVLEAANGASALKLVQEHEERPDLVVTDVVMPEMGGRELVEELRQDQPEIPVLYMSGYTQDEVLRRGVFEAEVFFLEKPFSPVQLLSKVHEALGVGGHSTPRSG